MKSCAIKSGVVTILLACLSGCSGGGGSGNSTPAPVISTLSFPVQSAYKELIAYGYTGNFTVSGSCNGTGNKTEASAATVETFEGVAALSAVGIIQQSYSNCVPASTAAAYTNYYDLTYTQLGYSDGVYGVFQAPPSLPTSVVVGDAGMIGTEALYADGTKAVSTGRLDLSYVIEADTPYSAIVNLTSKTYDTGGVLTSTVQDRYKITASGPLVPVSTDILTPGAAATHLLWTYNP